MVPSSNDVSVRLFSIIHQNRLRAMVMVTFIQINSSSLKQKGEEESLRYYSLWAADWKV